MTNIVAPFAGVVSQRQVNVGDMLGSGNTVGTSVSRAAFVDDRPGERCKAVFCTVPQRELQLFRSSAVGAAGDARGNGQRQR